MPTSINQIYAGAADIFECTLFLIFCFCLFENLEGTFAHLPTRFDLLSLTENMKRKKRLKITARKVAEFLKGRVYIMI